MDKTDQERVRLILSRYSKDHNWANICLQAEIAIALYDLRDSQRELTAHLKQAFSAELPLWRHDLTRRCKHCGASEGEHSGFGDKCPNPDNSPLQRLYLKTKFEAV